MGRRRARERRTAGGRGYSLTGGWGRGSEMANGNREAVDREKGVGRRRKVKSWGTFKVVGVTNARDACLDSPC